MVINNKINGFACKDTHYFIINQAFPQKSYSKRLHSIVQNQCRLRTDRRTAAKNLFGRILIDFAALAHYGVHGLGDINRYQLALGIKNHDDVTPVVTAGIVLQHEGNDA